MLSIRFILYPFLIQSVLDTNIYRHIFINYIVRTTLFRMMEIEMIDTRTAPYAAFVLRVSLALLFLAHAGLKIFVFTPAGTAGFFQSLGLPGFLAYLTIFAEVTGALLLLAGVFVRAVSLVLLPVLIGAIVFVHAQNGWLFSNENGGWEFPAFWAAALGVQALLGSGAYALRLGGAKAVRLQPAA
jgi:putative oxidoreductase